MWRQTEPTIVPMTSSDDWVTVPSETIWNRVQQALTHPADRPVMKIKLPIRRFDARVGRNVQREGDCSTAFAEGLGGPHALVCRSRSGEMAPGGYPELVRAQQQVVTDLAIRIASTARSWRRCSDSSCSTP